MYGCACAWVCRYVVGVRDLPAEEPADCREDSEHATTGDACRTGYDPRLLHSTQRGERRVREEATRADCEETNLWVALCRGNLRGAITLVPESELHVRLATAQKYIAKTYVRELCRLASRRREGEIRLGGTHGHGRQPLPPDSIGSRLCLQ